MSVNTLTLCVCVCVCVKLSTCQAIADVCQNKNHGTLYSLLIDTYSYRTLGVMRNESVEGSGWVFQGLIPMSDPPRHDTRDTILDALEKGIKVKMITGGRFGYFTMDICKYLSV